MAILQRRNWKELDWIDWVCFSIGIPVVLVTTYLLFNDRNENLIFFSYIGGILLIMVPNLRILFKGAIIRTKKPSK